MASSILQAGHAKAKRAKNYVDEGLEKVREKPWASPLGKALKGTAKIVDTVGPFPGAGFISGALSFGATLLNPEPTLEDLQKELREIKATIEGTSSQSLVQLLEKHQRDLEEKIAHPVGEIRLEYKEVRIEMKKVLHDIGELNKKVADEISTLRDQISHILNLVIDARFKVGSDEDREEINCILSPQDGIETVDAAYAVFVKDGFEDFQHYAFELRTCAEKNLNPRRVKEFLTVVFQQQGFAVCQVL